MAVPQPAIVFETTVVMYEADDVVEGGPVMTVSVVCVFPPPIVVLELLSVIVVLDTTMMV